MKYIDKIISSGKTIFDYNDIKNLLGMENKNSIKSFFARGVKSGIFVLLYKGIYAFKKYNILELAVKLKGNSYISFETVLKNQGIIFQDYGNTIFVASDNTLTKKIGNYTFKYLKIQSRILTNPLGIIQKGGYMIASKERALCDRIYLSRNYYFDYLDEIDKEKVLEIAQMYNKRVVLEVKKIMQHAG